jgi:hypothetical protein
MARSKRGSEPPQARSFTAEEAHDLVGRLRKRIEELQAIDPRTTRWDDPRVTALEAAIQDTAGEISWVRSPEGAEWRYFKFARQRVAIIRDDEEEFDEDMQAQFQQNIPRVVAGLEGLVRLVGERTVGRVTAGPVQRLEPSDTRLVFVVHGHNEAVKVEVARTLERLGLEPIILHEQADGGRTIIEKLEDHSDVAFAVVLMTGDDTGATRGGRDQPRARQNVILELGLFLGKLGRRRVRVLYEAGVEIPSDYLSVLYIPLDAGGAWRLRLVQEMRGVGLDVDANRL